MTEEEFLKKSFKPFMLIDYKNPRSGEVIECMVTSVDFDNRILRLCPLPEGPYEEKDFYVYCTYCEIPKPKLKLSK